MEMGVDEDIHSAGRLMTDCNDVVSDNVWVCECCYCM